MSNSPARYSSYLIRLWHERAVDESDAHTWCAEVEHIQTGERQRFVSPDDLWRYLRRQAAPSDDDTPGRSDEA
jgi:hypothetical protein